MRDRRVGETIADYHDNVLVPAAALEEVAQQNALLVKPDGSTERVHFDQTSGDYGLTQLQGWVGGWIEAIPVEGTFAIAYGNEDGKGLHLPANPAAQRVVGDVGLLPYDILVGTWVFVGLYDDEDNHEDLTEDQLVELERRALSPTATKGIS